MVCGCKFVVHLDFSSHTGGIMTMVQGVMQSVSRKQKLNTRSIIESKLVDVDNSSVYIL